MDAINEFILLAAASPWLLVVMFATSVIDGFFPPIPSETVLVAGAAVAVSTGDVLTTLLLCLIAGLGAVIGDNIAYAIGRTIGTTRFSWMRRPRVAALFVRSAQALRHRGTALIIGARYIPVGRVAVNMTAGALRYPRRRFLPLTVVAGLSWAAYSVAIGVAAGSWIKDQPLLSAGLGAGLAIIVGLAIDRIAVSRRRRREEETLSRDAACADR